ncbi:diacylglycerol kinase [Candidatus Endoriftia persephone]|jgi:diacylglycerol kinase (ATP)|uniref:Diacylglycerol kinase n=3 Tax=Gammaproteobacteria TaxID=1236 RepID=G2FIT4_9GAMM|nr:diacylglycerol kinase [Candidatus Endoriftia persephone]EGV51421.1 diacylglycerol kinase [endosymbiont of Riftia pachyptila (vent Ph05)]EGW53269.1 diacylglycerol kinase [endosymbiont of Tevnia jerichonana (vent Tica)]USF87808.1 diacylglycerol kinase [Candidatus Endoriftia persephone]
MAKPENNRGLRRLINATRWSMQGFASAYRHEAAFRQEVWLLAPLLPVGLWLGDSGVEKALLAGSLLIVLLVELLNSAVENVVDRIGDEPHKLSGRAKDQGSAAVFLALLLVVMTWGLVLLV